MMKVVRALTSRPIFDQHVSNEFGRVQHDLRDNEYDVGGYDEHWHNYKFWLFFFLLLVNKSKAYVVFRGLPNLLIYLSW